MFDISTTLNREKSCVPSLEIEYDVGIAARTRVRHPTVNASDVNADGATQHVQLRYHDQRGRATENVEQHRMA
jgi:hypothetical protein